MVHSNVKVMDIPAFFQPLVNCMRFLGFFISQSEEDAHRKSETVRILVLKSTRTVYLSLMWIWTIVMSINIIWLVIAETNEHEVNPVDGRSANMIIAVLNETPYAFITIRNAVILTLFVVNGIKIVSAVQWCEDLHCKFGLYGISLSMGKSSRRPLKFILATVAVIVLWEVYNWSTWFTSLGTMYSWNFVPFPFTLVHYYYAALWWVFTSVPFIFAQLSLAFPVLFATVIRKYVRMLNSEIRLLSLTASSDLHTEVHERELSQRLMRLRQLHFEINKLVAKIDKYISVMLLWQFVLDIVVLFGFVGLVVNSKYVKPPRMTIEWTFLLSSSVIWLDFFLFYYNIPLIQMANEGEKTHSLVHGLTISPAWLLQGKHTDLHIFLEETRHSATAFTGGNFYYINRHYIVMCIALLASEITVLAEISDRFYATLDIKEQLKHLIQLMGSNNTTSNYSTHGTESHPN